MNTEMASLAYEFHGGEKVADIASQFNTTIDEIMRVNNVLPPYPQYVENLPPEIIRNGTVQIPYVANGRQTFESYYNTTEETIGLQYNNVENLNETLLENATNRFLGASAFASRSIKPGRHNIDCYMSTPNGIIYFPCYPESVSDSNQASYSSEAILGRSEPFQYYTGSGPRSVSVKFQMHTDMLDNIDYVYTVADRVEACCYPRYGSGVVATRVRLHVANNIDITGIISNVSTDYSGPLLDTTGRTDIDTMDRPRYAVVDLSFSVTEVTGNPPSYTEISVRGGRR